ncbi:outer membrane protein [Pseudovibrio ascidiaceicola]|uniref:Outer membrane immunogenic protein n=1 Tax=Pseudovibrio ascidiaceicola TaxID=285279 RepID=A0A1I3VRE0_9HYPH|nr:outer membrane beta-barrel protein [Pseudovibrio ascidiaceicola]SFJ97974.1 outer membrane immunogenic protein [Pseudovibrio ascidiaceicola]
MSRLRVFAFAVLGLLGFSSHSFAVEYPPGVEVEEPYEVYEEEVVDGLITPPEYDWDGFYLGVQGGWARLHGTNRFNNSGTQYNGGTVGLYGGYNYTYQNILIGVEGEGAYWSFGERSRGEMSLRSDYFAAAKIRAGLTYDWFMAYVTGGAAVSTFRASNPNFGPGSDSNTMLGWVGGAGLEMFVTERVIVRLDYERIVFPGRSFTVGGTRFKEDIDSDAIRIGISYKF